MNELMTLIDQYEEREAKRIAEAVEQGIDNAIARRRQQEERTERARDIKAEHDIDEWKEQTYADFEAEGFK